MWLGNIQRDNRCLLIGCGENEELRDSTLFIHGPKTEHTYSFLWNSDTVNVGCAFYKKEFAIIMAMSLMVWWLRTAKPLRQNKIERLSSFEKGTFTTEKLPKTMPIPLAKNSAAHICPQKFKKHRHCSATSTPTKPPTASPGRRGTAGVGAGRAAVGVLFAVLGGRPSRPQLPPDGLEQVQPSHFADHRRNAPAVALRGATLLVDHVERLHRGRFNVSGLFRWSGGWREILRSACLRALLYGARACTARGCVEREVWGTEWGVNWSDCV